MNRWKAEFTSLLLVAATNVVAYAAEASPEPQPGEADQAPPTARPDDGYEKRPYTLRVGG